MLCVCTVGHEVTYGCDCARTVCNSQHGRLRSGVLLLVIRNHRCHGAPGCKTFYDMIARCGGVGMNTGAIAGGAR